MFRTALFALITCLAALPGLAASACDAAVAADLKVYEVPAHVYMTESAGANKTRSAETVYLNGATYVKTTGRWLKSPISPKDLEDAKKETDQKIGPCSVERDEAVNGEAATVYKIHAQSSDGVVDTEMWVSKSKGLPLKQVNEKVAGGAKTHTEIRYEYSNVTAPAAR